MSAAELYQERFAAGPADLFDVQVLHDELFKLLDTIVEASLGDTNLDDMHVFSMAKAGMAMLAAFDARLSELEQREREAGQETRTAPVSFAPAAPAQSAPAKRKGQLSSAVEFIQRAQRFEQAEGGYKFRWGPRA